MTDQPDALMQWARDAGSTPEDLVRFAILTIADRDAEIERLRADAKRDKDIVIDAILVTVERNAAEAALRQQHEEVEELREANEAFGKRQEWWNQKMFDMELEIATLNAILEKRK